jgi:transcriptional regulator with XRE-family HTH domain
LTFEGYLRHAVFGFERGESLVATKDIIRELRVKAHMTRSELADASGLSPETIKSYERGRRIPTVGSLSKILEAIGGEEDYRDMIRLIALRSKTDGIFPDGII